MSEDGDFTRPVVTDEMRNMIASIRKNERGKRRYIAELKANVSSHLEGTMENWPSNIQDGIYKALEEKGKGYTIQMSYCDHTPEDGWFIHVLATAEITEQ